MEISVFDEENDRSLVNLCPEPVKNRILASKAEIPDLFALCETDLLKMLRKIEQTPTPTDHRIRFKFWMEHERCQATMDKQISIKQILYGVSSVDFFYNAYLKNPAKVAWMVCPPANYEMKSMEALSYGLDEMRDILSQPHVVDGKFMSQIANTKLRIVSHLQRAIYGEAVQKTFNVHAHTGTVDGSGDNVPVEIARSISLNSMEDLKIKLKKAQDRYEQIVRGGVIDATLENE